MVRYAPFELKDHFVAILHFFKQANLGKRLKDVARNKLISDRATDPAKRELFAGLADQLTALAMRASVLLPE
jgi:hypothetical protein